jgi:GNAT superfamily N-acetyltransferase
VTGKLDLDVRPLTPERWPDLERLFGPNGACAGCWCMYWRLTRGAYEAGKPDGNRVAFRARVEAGPPPGLLAYTSDQAVGWCQLTPRAELPTLGRSRTLVAVDDLPVWSVSCFFVKAGWRRRGVGEALLGAAIERTRELGVAMLEAYPWDRAAKPAVGSAVLYTGVAATFERHGFREVARRAPHRPIMRLALAPAQGAASAWVPPRSTAR